MNKVVLVFLAITGFIFAQQKSNTVPKDTSFTNYSAAVKAYKKYPYAKLAGAVLPEGVNEDKDITYTSYGKRDLHLDIYSPSEKKGGLFPAVVFIHGGGWSSGDKTQEAALAQKLAKAGFVTALVEYRLSIEELYPAAVYDIKASIRWLRANSEKYNIDTNKIAVLGCSAGGQLVSFMGTTNGLKKFEGKGGNQDHSSRVQAVVNIDGLVDFTNIESTKYDTIPQKPSAASQWFGARYTEKPELWKEASPITYVSKDTPPFIFINSTLEHYHAGRDDMIAKIRELNIYYEVHTIADTPHPFWLFHPWFDQTYDYVLNFLNRVFKGV